MHTEFYDNRYKQGYMESWDKNKLLKVKEILQSMNLPKNGKAIDFGCGNGIFTNLLKENLPDWEIFGFEISPTALDNARKRYPNCKFLPISEIENHKNKFDLVFSHHVLEHVENIKETFNQLDALSSSSSKHLHILPCGNEGSLEYNISKMVKNGIEIDKENRFFFEEPGHNRRLSTKEFNSYMEKFNFHLENDYYNNQYWGALNWISKSSPRFVKKLTNPTLATNVENAKELQSLRLKILPITYIQHSLVLFLMYRDRFNRTTKEFFSMIFLSIPALFSWPIFSFFNRMANQEWNNNKNKSNGSEMFLIYKR
jgi:SAM-dependent methyltransferase